MYDSAPRRAAPLTNTSAYENDPVEPMIAPMTSGVTTPATFAPKLKMPPVNPMSRTGAMSEMMAQPRPVMPWAKNASDSTAIITRSLAV